MLKPGERVKLMIRHCRRQDGTRWSQNGLGRELNLPSSAIANLLSGKTNMKFTTMERILEIMDVPWEFLEHKTEHAAELYLVQRNYDQLTFPEQSAIEFRITGDSNDMDYLNKVMATVAWMRERDDAIAAGRTPPPAPTWIDEDNEFNMD